MLLCSFCVYIFYLTPRYKIEDELLNLRNIVPDKASSVAFLQQRGILHNPRNCANGHAKIDLREGLF